jgi:peptidoglycan/LPS O-acetylase OafA/YrhL
MLQKIKSYLQNIKNSLLENTEPTIRSYMPELDFIRGIAILMIILYHGFYWIVVNYGKLSEFHDIGKLIILSTKGGWLGVHLFFVLSGFLITGILLESKKRPDYYKRFYFRRALRILPAYFTILFLLWILGIAQWPFLLSSIFFTANFYILFNIPSQYGPLWTLAIEEQFYLLWPQAVKRLSKKSLTILALLFVIMTPILRWTSVILGHTEGLYLHTWFLTDGLALGAFLAIFIRSKYANRKNILNLGLGLVIISFSVILIGYPFGILSHKTFIGSILQLVPWYLLFAGFIYIVLIIGTSKYKQLVYWKWLRFLGYISYGLYLVHFLISMEFDNILNHFYPNINLLLHSTISGILIRFIITTTISILIAYLSRKYFEEFFLKFKNYKFNKINEYANQ